ncbi:MAG: hypothetical protein EPO11_00400 [Gammaproteobacteria bacterium]|nr:MAG: hypothetical protein EPO11_00400 [Gammaproteobacteria bacterium]
MNFKSFVVFVAIVVSFFCSCAFADSKESLDTIPFLTYKTRIIYYPAPKINSIASLQGGMSYSPSVTEASVSKNIQSTPIVVEQETSTRNVPIMDVQKSINQVRKALCNTIKDADFRIWVSVDASGKFLGLGASAQSGLEVTFHCKEKRL